MRLAPLAAVGLATALLACGDDAPTNTPDAAADPDAGADAGPGEFANWDREVLTTQLYVDVGELFGAATIELGPSDRPGVSFEAGGLSIEGAHIGEMFVLDWEPLPYEVKDGALHLDLQAADYPLLLTVYYRYEIQPRFEGVMSSGLTLTWPYYCGNVFPCRSNPAEGTRFTLELVGVDDGATTVYPSEIPAAAPAYMLAWAIGAYTQVDLGTTGAGTEVSVWHLPNGASAALAGTANLVGVVDWLETEIGPYLYGDHVGSVAASWGLGAFGGMEHHPYWHVSTGAMSSEVVHAHEAAHGWFGNGVRIACWEDFVLSEGTVSYLAARSLEAVAGAEAGETTWNRYAQRLAGVEDRIAWPEGCNQIDVIQDDLFTDAPYMKGAYFFRALEEKVGAAALDAALASFYQAYKGQAARFQDLLDVVATETGYDAGPCALAWLRATTVPTATSCP